mgnify:CR=1 FL=1
MGGAACICGAGRGSNARRFGARSQHFGHAQQRQLLAVALGALRAVLTTTLHVMDRLGAFDLVDHFGHDSGASLEILFRGASLSGGGQLVLSDSDHNALFGGSADTVLFNIDNSETWRAVFNEAATPYDFNTPGPVFQGEQLSLQLYGDLGRLSVPSTWPASQAPTHCRLLLQVQGISEMAVSGTRFDGRMRTQLTRLNPGYHLRLEIGFDCVIECVALSVNITDVEGIRDEKQL